MANTGYARKYELKQDRKVNNAVESTITYSMVTPAAPGTQIPGNGYTALSMSALMALSTEDYQTKLTQFITAIGTVPATRSSELKAMAEFADTYNCPMPSSAPVSGAAVLFSNLSATYGRHYCTGNNLGYHTFNISFKLTASKAGNYRVKVGSGVDQPEITVTVPSDNGLASGTITGIAHPNYHPFTTFLLLPDYSEVSPSIVVNSSPWDNPNDLCAGYWGPRDGSEIQDTF
jgi:hypothetical protein